MGRPKQSKQGGKRPGAGRKSIAQLTMQRLALAENKSVDQILAECETGFADSLRTVGLAMPAMLDSLVKKASQGDVQLQKFLIQLYFRYTSSLPERRSTLSPITNLINNLNVVVEEARARAIIEPITGPTVEASGVKVVEGTAEPGGVGDTARPDSN